MPKSTYTRIFNTLQFRHDNGVASLVLSDDYVLDNLKAQMLRVDTGAADRDFTLPGEEISRGSWYMILDIEDDGSSKMTVKNDDGDTIVELEGGERALVICDGTNWVHMGVETVALS